MHFRSADCRVKGIRLPVLRWILGVLLCFSGLLLAHAQGGTDVNGTVQDISSAPVAGVDVTLSSMDRALQTTSAGNGFFRFEKVPEGKYDLDFKKAGFLRNTLLIDTGSVEARTLNVTLQIGSLPDMDECGPHLTVRYAPLISGAHLTGMVSTYEDHRPMEHATVTLWRNGEHQPGMTARSNRSGAFAFERVPVNYYDLQVSRRGYRPMKFKHLLVPRLSSVAVDFSLLSTKEIVICE